MNEYLAKKVAQRYADLLQDEYFRLRRFAEDYKIKFVGIILSRENCFASIDDISVIEVDNSFTENEIVDYLNFKNLTLYNESIFTITSDKKFIIEEVDLVFNQVDVVDPAQYIQELLELGDTQSLKHFRVIDAHDFEKYTQIKREELHLNNTIPPSSFSNANQTLMKF